MSQGKSKLESVLTKSKFGSLTVNVGIISLRRRFQQNQQDCTFHIEALLPTLATNILEGLDVEGITFQLQQARTTKPSLPLPPTQTHLDTPSPSISVSALSTSESESAATTGSTDWNAVTAPSDLGSLNLPALDDEAPLIIPTPGSVTESWVDQFITHENTNGSLGSPASAAGQLYDSMASVSVIDNDQSSSVSFLYPHRVCEFGADGCILIAEWVVAWTV